MRGSPGPRKEGGDESESEVIAEGGEGDAELRPAVGTMSKKSRGKSLRRRRAINDLRVPPRDGAGLVGDSPSKSKPHPTRLVKGGAQKKDGLLGSTTEDPRMMSPAEVAGRQVSPRKRRASPSLTNETADFRDQRPPAKDDGGEELRDSVGGAAVE